jgi:hypothetical protein
MNAILWVPDMIGSQVDCMRPIGAYKDVERGPPKSTPDRLAATPTGDVAGRAIYNLIPDQN